MSSYLNIYLKVKNKEMKDSALILLDSFSRSSDIYQTINELGNFYSDNEKKEKTELTEYTLQEALEDLQGQINNCSMYITAAKELQSPEIQEVVEQKRYMKELEETRTYIEFLYNILINKDYNDIEGIYCYID